MLRRPDEQVNDIYTGRATALERLCLAEETYKEKLNIHRTYRLYGLTAMVQIFTNPTSTSLAACFNLSSRVASGSPARRANSR